MPFLTILIAAQLAASAPAVDGSSLRLQALVRSAGYQQNVTHLFATLPPEVFRRCRSLVSAGSQVTVVEPPVFAADGLPTAGSWRQSFPVSGCGNDTTITLFFRGRPDEQIVSVVGTPGGTIADLTLQRDALFFVRTAALSRQPDCHALIVTDSRFVGRFTRGASHGWREEWTASACGHAVRVPLTFVPDATGTTVTASPPVPVG